MKNQNLFSEMCMRQKESELKKAPDNNRPTGTRSGY